MFDKKLLKYNSTVICVSDNSDLVEGLSYLVSNVSDDGLYIKVIGRDSWYPFTVVKQPCQPKIITGCHHDWKEIKGLTKSWYNCKLCDIKREEVYEY